MTQDPSTGDNTLLLALQALEAADYKHALTLVNEAIEQGISWDAGKAEALNLRGTFKYVLTNIHTRFHLNSAYTNRFLTGSVHEAMTDLQQSIELVPSLTQSHVKLASVYMEQGDTTQTFKCFETAIEHNPNDPDIYYHRGQGEPFFCVDVRPSDNMGTDSAFHHERLQGGCGELHQVDRIGRQIRV